MNKLLYNTNGVPGKGGIPGVQGVYPSGQQNLSQITSNDYDAPLTETGDLTEIYYAIRDVISRVNNYIFFL